MGTCAASTRTTVQTPSIFLYFLRSFCCLSFFQILWIRDSAHLSDADYPPLTAALVPRWRSRQDSQAPVGAGDGSQIPSFCSQFNSVVVDVDVVVCFCFLFFCFLCWLSASYSKYEAHATLRMPNSRDASNLLAHARLCSRDLASAGIRRNTFFFFVFVVDFIKFCNSKFATCSSCSKYHFFWIVGLKISAAFWCSCNCGYRGCVRTLWRS